MEMKRKVSRERRRKGSVGWRGDGRLLEIL